MTRISVGDSVFDVRHRGNLAEAIRVNPRYAPRLGPIRGEAGFAMAYVSGCEVAGVLGDQAVTTGILVCSDAQITNAQQAITYTCRSASPAPIAIDRNRPPDVICAPD